MSNGLNDVGVRFLLYNIRYCAGTGAHFHMPFPCSGYLRPTQSNLERVTAFIRSLDPDIAGLVEVDGGSYRSGRINQAEYIAAALGQYHAYQSKYDERSLFQRVPVFNKQVNAFVTRDRIHGQRFHYFEQGMKRLVIELELETLTIFLVHLSLTFRRRQSQLAELYRLVREVRKPVIVAGDFNAFWGDPEIRLFLAATGLQSANREGRPSFPSWNPRRQLDFVLHSKKICVQSFTIPPVTYSDHLPLLCDFEVA